MTDTWTGFLPACTRGRITVDESASIPFRSVHPSYAQNVGAVTGDDQGN